ncbi:MAG: hypothetical protein SGJ15_13380 [Bacteroidota bacterium]|nr:hypothetical protein [Bacteroidota bacterium]
MKTILTLIALALTIQVMVKGQTQGNQASKKGKFENLIVGGSISAYNKSLQSTSTLKDAQSYQAQAEELQLSEKKLRAQANTKKGQEKAQLIASANKIAKQIEAIQIQASEIYGKFNLETFQFVEEVYSALLKDPNVNDSYINRSEQLKIQAEQTLKLAKEMRQEAYAMPNNAGKLGTMQNAEEMEGIALGKQKEAVNILNKVSSVTFAIK